MSRTRINSMKALQELFPEILDQLRDDHRAMVAAMANPILALEDLGYELSPRVLVALEDRARFDKKMAAQRRRLRTKIFEAVGHSFDLSSAEEVSGVLSDLGVGTRAWVQKAVAQTKYRPSCREQAKPSDPLERLKGKHPVVKLLLEYRRIDALTPPFASRRLYEETRTGKRSFAITAIRVRGAAESKVVAESKAEASD